MITLKHFNDTGFIAHMNQKKSNKNKEAVEFFLKYFAIISFRFVHNAKLQCGL